MKYYAVIDTNVIVSYLLTQNSNSTIHKLIGAIKNQTLIPL
jgi:predicted nucleic acid-binding protein